MSQGRLALSAAALEARRLSAIPHFEAGRRLEDIADALEVERSTVTRWRLMWQRGGADALRARPNRGRAARLTPAQLAAVTRAAQGKRLTTTKLAAWIERHFGVRYGRTHVWKLARRYGWPLERARREDR